MKVFALAVLALSLAPLTQAQMIPPFGSGIILAPDQSQMIPVYQYQQPQPIQIYNPAPQLSFYQPWQNVSNMLNQYQYQQPTYYYQQPIQQYQWQPTYNQYPVTQDYELPQTYWQRQSDGSQLAVDEDGDPY